LVPTHEGKPYFVDEEGGHWRAFPFIRDSICLQKAESPEDFRQSAVAFGQFQRMLADFPAAQLHESIANFHNTVDRYRLFHEALNADCKGRAATCQAEIDFYLAREAEAGAIVERLADGRLPLRVTHNDTKLNNVMLDFDSRLPLCVIDLDTIMPGSALYDFGDSIRFGAATAAEDEQDLSKVSMSLELFRIYTEGFLSACGESLTETEIAMLPMGAKMMTLECGLRFLTDYLKGDTYFKTSRDGQNLDRARTQMTLVADMEAKWEQMAQIVRGAHK
jgi:Ser/Thr protein kinase RdoA (MazF antagonist)